MRDVERTNLFKVQSLLNELNNLHQLWCETWIWMLPLVVNSEYIWGNKEGGGGGGRVKLNYVIVVL